MGKKILSANVFGVNLVSLITATIAFYIVGAVIYGVLFGKTWTALTLASLGVVDIDIALSLSREGLMLHWERAFPDVNQAVTMGIGIVPVLVTSLVLAWLIRAVKPESLGQTAALATLIWLGFAATGIGAQVNYSFYDLRLAGMDLLYTFLGYVISASVYYLVSLKCASALAGAPAASKPSPAPAPAAPEPPKAPAAPAAPEPPKAPKAKTTAKPRKKPAAKSSGKS